MEKDDIFNFFEEDPPGLAWYFQTCGFTPLSDWRRQLEVSRSRAVQLGHRVVLLPPLFDIDTHTDLERVPGINVTL